MKAHYHKCRNCEAKIFVQCGCGHAKVNTEICFTCSTTKAVLTDAAQWLGKLIADKGHENSIMPNHAVNTLARVEALIAKLA